MNYLVFLDTRAGELERILSGVKTMLVKEFDPAKIPACPIQPGDSLYFLRDQDDCAIRVKATVLRVLFFTNHTEDEPSQTLKEMQPRLQLTEEQYRYWVVKQQLMLVEFGSAHKIVSTRVAPEMITDPPGWIAFEDFDRFVKGVKNEHIGLYGD